MTGTEYEKPNRETNEELSQHPMVAENNWSTLDSPENLLGLTELTWSCCKKHGPGDELQETAKAKKDLL